MGIMMNKGQVFLFGILLGALVLALAESLVVKRPPQKQGTCPPQRNKLAGSPFRCASLCTNDYKCDGDKKCCLDNCHKICKPPAKERQGVCPTLTVTSRNSSCYDFCTSDSECSEGSKCCESACGRTCTSTIKVKEGFCLQEQVLKCSASEANYCASDKNCYKDEKCCPKLCRMECQKPLTERAGICPPAPSNCTAFANKVCQSDKDCEILYKCCNTKCGNQRLCLKAVNVPTFFVFGPGIPVFPLNPNKP
ncbi:whey acidic protein-like [Xenopus laevis]|uniref:WAP domain-containing protein n=2 Tax=Xenopus laevis TaxID=8355 RepID=A0A974H383_XENLA|nr:whey acidic protein-like [Xenopus laevis]OCT62806.1 hypothetical protein XELAEV_18043897mg [Xenopus laevis]